MSQSEIMILSSSDDDDVIFKGYKRINENVVVHLDDDEELFKSDDAAVNISNSVPSQFQEFLELICRLQDTKEIRNVIKHLLIPSYSEADKSYVTSAKFEGVLKKVSHDMLQRQVPSFTGIKQVLLSLKANKKMRRVEIITLDSELHLDKTQENGNRKKSRKKVKQINNTLKSEIVETNSNGGVKEIRNCPSHVSESCSEIENIERKIEICKRRIKTLEESEVDLNNSASAYVVCHRYKSKLVNLYKRLCSLTNKPIVDPHTRMQFTLAVPEGHAEGPARRLQDWLNRRLKDNETYPFPDFQDVVTCVAAANKEDSLGWTPNQVLLEARILFLQCGRELQKRRQMREWRDLVEMLPDNEDPAQHNPDLEARLVDNQKIGLVKEKELLEFYVQQESNIALDNRTKAKRKRFEASQNETDDAKQANIVSDNDIEITGEKLDLSTYIPRGNMNLLFVKNEEMDNIFEGNEKVSEELAEHTSDQPVDYLPPNEPYNIVGYVIEERKPAIKIIFDQSDDEDCFNYNNS